jgi:hypothetical protein
VGGCFLPLDMCGESALPRTESSIQSLRETGLASKNLMDLTRLSSDGEAARSLSHTRTCALISRVRSDPCERISRLLTASRPHSLVRRRQELTDRPGTPRPSRPNAQGRSSPHYWVRLKDLRATRSWMRARSSFLLGVGRRAANRTLHGHRPAAAQKWTSRRCNAMRRRAV